MSTELATALAALGFSAATPTVVQAKAFVQNDAPFVLASAPTPGNLLVALATHWSTAIAIGAGWTAALNIAGATTDGLVIAVKYVAGTDTASLSPFTGANGTDCAVFEISGGSGAIPLNMASYKEAVGTTNSMVVKALRDNSLLIGMFATLNGNTAPTAINGVTSLTLVTAATATLTNGGARRCDPFYANVLKSTSIGPTVTFAGSTTNFGICVVIPPA